MQVAGSYTAFGLKLIDSRVCMRSAAAVAIAMTRQVWSNRYICSGRTRAITSSAPSPSMPGTSASYANTVRLALSTIGWNAMRTSNASRSSPWQLAHGCGLPTSPKNDFRNIARAR